MSVHPTSRSPFRPTPRTPASGAGLEGIDRTKLMRAREILGSVSALEAIEIALDLLILDDAHAAERPPRDFPDG